MSEKRADRPRYWVAHLLKDLPEGADFKPEVLHLTIIPWFVTELDEQQTVKSFYECFSDEAAFAGVVGKIGEFKHQREITVNFIEQSPQILHLHMKALTWFETLEARWAVKNPHVSAEYIPHIRRRAGYNVNEGEVLHIDSLSLVRAHRRGDDLRIVDAKVELK